MVFCFILQNLYLRIIKILFYFILQNLESIIIIKILTISEWLFIAKASHRSTAATFVFKLDSFNKIFWFLNLVSVSWKFQNVIKSVISSFSRHVNWSIFHIRWIGEWCSWHLSSFGGSGTLHYWFHLNLGCFYPLKIMWLLLFSFPFNNILSFKKKNTIYFP